MTVQDAVLAAGSWLFVIALAPAMVSGPRPPRSTCVMTGGVLIAFAVVYASLDLWNAAVSSLVLGMCWLGLSLKEK